MSPSPADVGYRSSSVDAGRSREFSTSLPTKESGLQWNERSGGTSQSGVGGGGGKGGRAALSRTSSAEPVTRGRPPPVSTSLPSGSGSLTGCGPVNMPSSISVQELKQMTALRMAHEQGHLRVVSPFRFSVGGGKQQQQQVNSRGSSPLKGERDQDSGSNSSNAPHGRNAYISRTPSMRSNSSGGEGGSSAPEEGSHRPHRHSLDFLVAGSATCGGSQNQNSSPGDIPPTPSSSCSGGSSRSGGQRSRGSPSPQGRQSPVLGPLSSSSSRTTPPTSSMPHGLTVQELKEMTKMRLAREAFNIPVYAVLQSSSQHHQPDPKRGVSGGGGVGGGGVASRGRGTSPASKGGRHPDNRASSAAMSVGRSSTPASPGNGDRPHRRTRRGGRRGRNRSPRPDENFSQKHAGSREMGMGMDSSGRSSVGFAPRDGFSSASPSGSRARWLNTEHHGHHPPWGDLDDEQPRSSSQPRAVVCGDHVFSGGGNREKELQEGEEVSGGVSDGGGVIEGDDARGSDRSSFSGSPAPSPVPDDGLENGGSGGGGSGESVDGMTGAGEGVRGDCIASSSSSGHADGVGVVREGIPWEPRTDEGGDNGCGGDVGVSAEESIAEVERYHSRGSCDGNSHRDVGGELEREMVEMGRSRTAAQHDLEWSNEEEHTPRQSRFCVKADGSSGLRVAGMVGPERTTTLRGYDPHEEDGSHRHRMHLHLHLHRSRSSDSALVSDERIRDNPRYSHPRVSNHEQYRYDHVGCSSNSGHQRHVYGIDNCDSHHSGAGVGVIGGGAEKRGGNGGNSVFFGERYSDDDLFRQQRHQQHRGRGGGVGSRHENHQESARLLLLPGSVDRGGDQDSVPRFDSQRQQRSREGASRSWNHNGSPSLPPQVPCLSSRRSDGGSVATMGSARGGLVSRGVGGYGGVHHGGSGGFSSVDDDISYTVAESVFMSSNSPWKSNRSQHQASSGTEGGDDSWHVPSLAAGAVLTPQSFGVYESENTGYRDEGSSQPAYLQPSDDSEHVMLPKLHHHPHSAHQLGSTSSHHQDYYRRDMNVTRGDASGSNNIDPVFGGTERFNASPSARRRGAVSAVRMEELEAAGHVDSLVTARSDSGGRGGVSSSRVRLGSSYPSQSPAGSAPRYPGRPPNPYMRDSLSVGGGHGSTAKGGNGIMRRMTPLSPSMVGSPAGSSAGDGGRGARIAIAASSAVGGSDSGGIIANGNSSSSSPLISGVRFSLELGGCPQENVGRKSSEGKRAGSSSVDMVGLEYPSDGAGRSVVASPVSHRSGDSGSSVPSLPRWLDIGSSVGGVLGSAVRVGEGGGGGMGAEASLFSHGRGSGLGGVGAENESNSNPTMGCRLSRSISSTLPAGRDRSAGHPGTIGSSRRSINNSSSSVQSSPLLGTTGTAEPGSHTDFDVVFPGLEISRTAYGEGAGVGKGLEGGVGAFGNMSLKEFFGVCSS